MRRTLGPCLVVGLGLATLACRAEPTPGHADPTVASADSSGPSEPGSGSPATPDDGDPFAGIEPLRPEAWTGWPLENVDLELETGWRIDVTTGKFALERGLVLAAEPGAFVLAIAPGEVTELRRTSEPEPAIELVIAHGDGIESHYAPLADALVHTDLPVARGSAIGLARGPTLRLIVTVDGVAIDPLLVLRQPLHRWPALLRTLPAPAEPG